MKQKRKMCPLPGCKRDTYNGARGVCMNHYSAFHNRVKRGTTTWEELEVAGLVQPKRYDGGRLLNILPVSEMELNKQLEYVQNKIKLLKEKEIELLKLKYESI